MEDEDIECVDASVAECACTENDLWDNDCCAFAGTGGCLPGYTPKVLASAGYCDGSSAEAATGPVSTCCVPIPGYFENNERGSGKAKADGTSNEPPLWISKARPLNTTARTDWCEADPYYADKCESPASAHARTLIGTLAGSACCRRAADTRRAQVILLAGKHKSHTTRHSWQRCSHSWQPVRLLPMGPAVLPAMSCRLTYARRWFDHRPRSRYRG